MKVGKTMQFASGAGWRAWLTQHHNSEKELWLVLCKKRAADKGLAYQEALDEALCYGWIDGTLRRIDDEKHMVRFSPRKSRSIWSKANRARAEKLVAQGRMTGAGLAKIEQAKANGEWYREWSDDKGPIVPADLIEALKSNEKAEKNWEKFPPSLKQQFAYWITRAKRDDTRNNRIRKTVEMARRNERPG